MRIFELFDQLCREGTCVPCELNLVGGEAAWAERLGYVDPLGVAVEHARLGVLNAAAHDVHRARAQLVELGIAPHPRERAAC